MANEKKKKNNATSQASTSLDNSMGDYDATWITDQAWMSGVSGAAAVIGLAAWYKANDVLSKGLYLFGKQITDQSNESILVALLTITCIMVIVETLRISRRPGVFFCLSPKLNSKEYLGFFFECLINYLLYLCVLWIILCFYQTAGEYGFSRNAPYYQGWFLFIDWVWLGYLYGGLPYTLITRAFKYDRIADSRDYGFYFFRLLLYPLHKIGGILDEKHRLSEIDRKITRGLLVKMFFTPLMTVFFISQFPHLVNNLGYLSGGLWQAILSDGLWQAILSDGLWQAILSDDLWQAILSDGLWQTIGNGGYSNSQLNKDLFNISISFVFSIDVALAWCGYVISSRWVDNQTVSAEPTTLGWLVCLICYPPFQQFLGFYYSAPGEKQAIYMLHQQWLITVFLLLMISSYIVYMSATLWFGTRFSNLTHRGIIRKGPFSIVRHPAYASKNFAWWCIMFPAIIYNAFHNNLQPAILQTLGLVLMTYVYYWRAITEERHLSADQAYLDYRQRVRYRFIPGVI